jgi:hypothetical protein
MGSCGNKDKSQNETGTVGRQGSFAFDLSFLRKRDTGLIVLHAGNSKVVVSPKYQAKVFTSTTGGEEGRSLGWVNYKAFDAQEDPHMNAYGGENRFWLGPEGNAFSLYFKPGTEMVFDNWKTPSPIDTESWEVVSSDSKGVTLQMKMVLLNYSNTELKLMANRTIAILDEAQIARQLLIETGKVKSVGFSTSNSIENIGDFPWTEQTGAPCIWILDMFPPTAKTTIFIPYNEVGTGPVATTDYFGEIPADRIAYANNTLYFKADGMHRGKAGIPPLRAKQYAGSYDAINQVLTIACFDIDKNAVYLNQEWNLDAPPFKGDAVNTYNDGPLEDGSQMGPFYEIESVSPAAFLSPGEKLVHTHTVFHFTGDAHELNRISEKVLGISIKNIAGVFKAN